MGGTWKKRTPRLLLPLPLLGTSAELRPLQAQAPKPAARSSPLLRAPLHLPKAAAGLLPELQIPFGGAVR